MNALGLFRIYLLLTIINKNRTEILRSRNVKTKKKICAARVTVLEKAAVQVEGAERASQHWLTGLKFATGSWKAVHEEVEVMAALGACGLVAGETPPRDSPPPSAGHSAPFLRKKKP